MLSPFLFMTLAYMGYIDQARGRIDGLMWEARQLGHAHALAAVLHHANWIDWITSSPMSHVDEFEVLTTEHGFTFYLGWALAWRGKSLLLRGQAQEGLASVLQGLTKLRATGSVSSEPRMLTWLAEAHAMLGQSAEERDCLAAAARMIEATDERDSEAELLHRVPGDLLKAEGDRAGAERHYRQAIAVAERQGAKLLQLKASVSLARLWRDQGKRADARDLLAPIYGWFTEGFDAPDLKGCQCAAE